MVKALLSYIDALETDLNTQLPGVLAGETEPVHEFRVDLKKTRTVLNFIHFWLYGHSSKTVLYRKIRPVFRLSGKTRELHIHQSLLPELEDKTGLDLTFLIKKIGYQVKRNQPPLKSIALDLQKELPGVFQAIKQQVEHADEAKSRHDAPMAFQLRLEQKIKNQLRAENPDLHRIRRILKQKVHIYDSFMESELLSFYKEFREEWKILESSIGHWHDEQVFMHWLQKGLHWKRLTDEQYKTMLKLIAHLKASTTRMEKELLKTVPQLNT